MNVRNSSVDFLHGIVQIGLPALWLMGGVFSLKQYGAKIRLPTTSILLRRKFHELTLSKIKNLNSIAFKTIKGINHLLPSLVCSLGAWYRRWINTRGFAAGTRGKGCVVSDDVTVIEEVTEEVIGEG